MRRPETGRLLILYVSRACARPASLIWLYDTQSIAHVKGRFLHAPRFFGIICSVKRTDGKDGTDMKHSEKTCLWTGAGALLAFILFTLLVRLADVRAVGPMGSEVGFASVNAWFHRLTGVHMVLYAVTDWLGLVPVFICFCFGVLGLIQLIKRRSLRRVDPDVILLGVYFFIVILAYLVFEAVPINFRPVTIDGRLEASYPSSTTLLVLSVMPAFAFQTDRRCRSAAIRAAARVFAAVFSAFTATGRLVSGVHWLTDIAASVLLSAGLFLLYRAAVGFSDGKRRKRGIQ